jgi:uncharacterized protein (DUF58 family)
VRGAIAGAHQSRQRGTSAEFTEYRLYRQGDDTRRIDWRLLARSDRAYIRLATDRAVLPTLIAIDASASMAFPESGVSKWDYARQVAVGLAGVAHAQGDPVGATIAAGDRRIDLEPRSRRSVVAEIASALDEATARGGTSLHEHLLGRSMPPRLVIISDLLGGLDELCRVVRAHVAGAGECYVIHVVSPLELAPPERTVLAVDPENDSVRRPLSSQSRAAYVEAFGSWRADAAQRCREAGAVYLEASSDEPADRTVRRIAGGAR